MINQELMLDSVSSHGFIVGSIDQLGNVSFSAKPLVHANDTLAATEADRLAKLYPGKAYVWAQLRGAFICNKVTRY